MSDQAAYDKAMSEPLNGVDRLRLWLTDPDTFSSIDLTDAEDVLERYDAQAAEIATLRKALEPFTKLELWSDTYPDAKADNRSRRYTILPSEIRNARAAYEGKADG